MMGYIYLCLSHTHFGWSIQEILMYNMIDHHIRVENCQPKTGAGLKSNKDHK